MFVDSSVNSISQKTYSWLNFSCANRIESHREKTFAKNLSKVMQLALSVLQNHQSVKQKTAEADKRVTWSAHIVSQARQQY